MVGCSIKKAWSRRAVPLERWVFASVLVTAFFGVALQSSIVTSTHDLQPRVTEAAEGPRVASSAWSRAELAAHHAGLVRGVVVVAVAGVWEGDGGAALRLTTPAFDAPLISLGGLSADAWLSYALEGSCCVAGPRMRTLALADGASVPALDFLAELGLAVVPIGTSGLANAVVPERHGQTVLSLRDLLALGRRVTTEPVGVSDWMCANAASRLHLARVAAQPIVGALKGMPVGAPVAAGGFAGGDPAPNNVNTCLAAPPVVLVHHEPYSLCTHHTFGGWPGTLRALAATLPLASDMYESACLVGGAALPNLQLVDFAERVFAWDVWIPEEDAAAMMRAGGRMSLAARLAAGERPGTPPLDAPFAAFFHHPPGSPQHDRHFSTPQAILARPMWRASQPWCVAIFVLSEYLSTWLAAHLPHPHPPIVVLHHPTFVPAAQFSWAEYASASPQWVLSMGLPQRNFTAFAALAVPHSHRKALLVLRDDIIPCVARELALADARMTPPPSLGLGDDVTFAKLSTEDLDVALTRSIVFLHLYDASANNAIIECVVRGTPVLVNRLPAVVEYLGSDYPLLYTDLAHAARLLGDPERVRAAHTYLVRLRERAPYSYRAFSQILLQLPLWAHLRAWMPPQGDPRARLAAALMPPAEDNAGGYTAPVVVALGAASLLLRWAIAAQGQGAATASSAPPSFARLLFVATSNADADFINAAMGSDRVYAVCGDAAGEDVCTRVAAHTPTGVMWHSSMHDAAAWAHTTTAALQIAISAATRDPMPWPQVAAALAMEWPPLAARTALDATLAREAAVAAATEQLATPITMVGRLRSPSSKPACLSPPRTWALSRIIAPRLNVPTDTELRVYERVLVGSAMCGIDGASPVVWTTHASSGRVLSLVPELLARWRGCVSLAVHVCSPDAWGAISAAWHADPMWRQWLTLHAIVGAGDGIRTEYPINVCRNVAMDGVADRGSPRPAWLAVIDGDALPSAPASVFARALAAAASDERDPPRAEGDGDACHAASVALSPPTGHFGSRGAAAWAASDAITSRVLSLATLCPRAHAANRTLFAIASFDPADVRDERAVLGTLLGSVVVDVAGERAAVKDVREDAAAATAHQRLAQALKDGVMTHQSAHSPPSYIGIVPWRAWLQLSCGRAMPIRWLEGFEPYFAVASAVAPRFDEAFRGPHHNKQALFPPLLTQQGAGSDAWGLALLSCVYLAQRNASSIIPPFNREAFALYETVRRREGACTTHATCMAPLDNVAAMKNMTGHTMTTEP